MGSLKRTILRSVGAISLAIIFGGWYGCFTSSSTGGFPVDTLDVIVAGGKVVSKTPHEAQVRGNAIQTDGTGTVTTFNVDTGSGGHAQISGGMTGVDWNSDVLWGGFCGTQIFQSGFFPNVNSETGIGWGCFIPSISIPFASTHFAWQGNQPPTLTLGAQGLTTVNGAPELLVYDRSGTVVASSFAQSVSSDGSSAVFPFPVDASGNLPQPDLHGITIFDAGSGAYAWNAVNYLDLGQNVMLSGNTPFTTPFGVDASSFVVTRISCVQVGNRLRCFTSRNTTVRPIVTEYSANQVAVQGNSINVGVNPTAVKFYAVQDVSISDTDLVSVISTQPTKAIVANSGSATVSVVDIVNHIEQVEIPVGAQPVALLLNADQSKAYVACYGAGAVYEIDLASNAVTRVANVGAGASSLAMDPSNSAIWVGANNQIARVDLTSFAVTSIAVNGSVNSLVASAGQNQLVYTVVNGAASLPQTSSQGTASQGNPSNISFGQMSLASPTTATIFQTQDASAYQAASTVNGTLPSASIVSASALASLQYGNLFVVTATPTGFAVIDVSSASVFMQGNTPGAVRGIAADAAQGEVFLTVPDANLVLRLPLPPQT
jgi:hypothetical protein